MIFNQRCRYSNRESAVLIVRKKQMEAVYAEGISDYSAFYVIQGKENSPFRRKRKFT